ncbi:hypothetical protein SAMN04488029_2142 [Reichenbachiella faecimaris]|uniref:Uncharacterized protein n=2 Tax=Reichenbachiella faecimaris TaxID=692418 RepID=A0A1W2GDE2_REIFA|nr:hypothetical protein SAMN04488029_2142 [Reichenbachiella faecimaris]
MGVQFCLNILNKFVRNVFGFSYLFVELDRPLAMKFTAFILLLLPTLVFGQSYTTTGFKPGYVVLNSGERKDGEVNYRVSTPDREILMIRYKNGKDKANYYPDELQDHGQTVLIADEKNNYSDVSRNFNPGYVILSDGSKIEGKVAGRTKEPHESQYKNYGPVAVKYANDKDEVTKYWANKKEVLYYVQSINGKETHYINLYDYFVEVGNPTGRFSYFVNPRPTHINESATNLSKNLAALAEEQATKLAASAAAKKSFEIDQNKGTDAAVGNATIAAMNAATAVQDAIDVEGADDILYKEYFIVDNKNKTRSVVYKKNIDQVLNALLDGCGLDEKIVEKTGSIKELTEVMGFLEENACN